MDRKKRIAAALCLLLIMLLTTAAHATEQTVSGAVRVYLSSIGTLSSVDLTISGSYSVGGDASKALSRGASVNVRNSGGTLILTSGGQSTSMGTQFKLRRHQTTGENGVRIAQARYPGSLYPGDIEFRVRGSYVQIIVHVFMEDYMRGVLPYEMDNSFPLEALKAQAVAARTYALKKMSQQAATYDVVDTTSDQVYNGTPQGNATCLRAVSETDGLVGLVGGEFMASYYTASNGGQTESAQNAWGSGSYAYLTVKDDPYDLRNPASVAKSVSFYADGTTSNASLTALLQKQAAQMLGAQNVTINAITSVSAYEPRFAEPSRVYAKVDVGLRVADYGEITVTLDYFNQIEPLCSMSINVLKNETLMVTQTVGGFKLTARRYGHGVGMSQRGAQQMATEGLTFRDILQFYYPGIVPTKYTFTHMILPAIDGTTEAVSGTVTEGGEAIVTLSNPLDSLNLRAEANTTSQILARIPHGMQLTLLSMGDSWSRVQYGMLTGYVSNGYISVQDGEPQKPETGIVSHGTAVVSLSDESQTLNLRAAPTSGASVLSRLRHGTVLTVLERYERWTYVQFGTLKGYVSNEYIAYDAAGGETDSSAPMPDMESGSMQAAVRLQSASSGLNVREAASATAAVLTRLNNGQRVSVVEYGAQWCRVSVGGVTGYCATAYLAFDEKQEQGTTQQGVQTAIVLPSDGLNLRAQASRTSEVRMTLPQGTMLTVTGDAVGEMLPVRLGSISGYVVTEYVFVTVLPQTTPEPTEAPQQNVQTAHAAKVTASSGLLLRTRPVVGTAIITMPRGAVVQITGEETEGYYPVAYGEYTGYASAQYLAPTDEAPTTPKPTARPTPEITESPAVQATKPPASQVLSGQVGTVTAEGGLNLREQPFSGANVLATLAYDAQVTVTGEAVDGFYPVRVGSLSGYASTEYIAIGQQRNEQQSAPTSTPTPAAQTLGSRVLVASENGLNLRATPNTFGEVVYVLPYGMVLDVLGESENDFLYVRWANYTGYVSRAYVAPISSAE